MNRGDRMFGKKKKETPAAANKSASTGAAPVEKKAPSTQSWLPILDIKNSLVYRTDNAIVAGIRVQPVNINLLSNNEKLRRVKRLEEVLNGIDYLYQIIVLGKPVDLDPYIQKLETRRGETTSIIKKNLLNIYSKQAAAKATSGEALEKHFYLLIDSPLGNKPQIAEQVLLQRAIQLSSNLTGAELISSVCTDSELRSLNFIFTNPAQAAFERSPDDISALPSILYYPEGEQA